MAQQEVVMWHLGGCQLRPSATEQRQKDKGISNSVKMFSSDVLSDV